MITLEQQNLMFLRRKIFASRMLSGKEKIELFLLVDKLEARKATEQDKERIMELAEMVL